MMIVKGIDNLIFAEEGIFFSFPIAARQSLARLICDNLLSVLMAPTQLSTCVHVRIMLECVGQCFALPLDSSHIIESGIEIYRRWLLEPKKQPPPIQEDEQFFYKEMFKHLSLVFIKRAITESAEILPEPRSNRQLHKEISNNNQEHLNLHTNLCNSVLALFRSVGVVLRKRMMDDTWEALLKIVLGIADSMLSEPEGTSIVAEQLTSNMINVRINRQIEKLEKLFAHKNSDLL
jgi:hypothetical protein